MNSTIKPIFVFSLPRAGSTLLQRILGATPEIATVTEPWILLPYLYTLKPGGICAEYSHWRLHQAITDFYQELPQGKNDYLNEVRTMVLNLYTKLCYNNEQYFLDKTPRYHLVINEIIDLFPEGKFIILWRNPLSVVASIIQTFGLGYWNLRDYYIDLFDGINNLILASKTHKNMICCVKYEDIIQSPDLELNRIFTYLDMPFNPKIIQEFMGVNLKGNFGDPTGVNDYQSISQEPTKKWQNILKNPVRKAWSRRYLQWLGEEKLTTMGYNLNQLMEELSQGSLSLDKMPSDLKKITLDTCQIWLENLSTQKVVNPERWWTFNIPYS